MSETQETTSIDATTPKGIEKVRAVVEDIKAKTEQEKLEEETKKTNPTGIEPKVKKLKKAKKEVAIVEEASITPAEIRDGQIIFTQKHIALIKSQIAPTATQSEFELFLMMARRMRLDPLLRQLYFIKYKDKVSYVTSIDSYRIIAHRTEQFAGTDEPMYTYDPSAQNKKPTHCSIVVYRLVQGIRCGFAAKVKFSEYDTNQNNWAKMPETMIAKVAEAHALRKAFPQDLAGVYTQEEMDQAGTTPAQISGQPQTPPVKMMTEMQKQNIISLLKQKGQTKEDIHRYMEINFKTTDSSKLTLEQANRIINVLSQLPDPQVDEAEQVFRSEPTPEEVNAMKEQDEQINEAIKDGKL